MKIFIPTKGRPDKQPTAKALDEAGVPFKFVCTLNDPTLEQYMHKWGSLRVMAVDVDNLMQKRQLIFQGLRNPGPKICMMDDDLTFYAREKHGGFWKANLIEVGKMVETIERQLDDYAHVGLVDKFMSQNQPRGFKYSGRYNQVLAYNTAMIHRRWNRKTFKIDYVYPQPAFRSRLNQEHEMHLQLLRIGLPPCILCEYSKNAAYYSEGGLTGFRTPSMERAVFKELARNWPSYVRLRETKHSIGGIAATFNWRRATQEGLARWEGLK